MVDRFLGIRTNIFGSPFASAKCDGANSLPVKRNVMPAIAEGGKWTRYELTTAVLTDRKICESGS